MSHVRCSKTICTDIEDMKSAVARFPELEWCEGKKDFKWFGSWANDYAREDAAYKNGIDVDQYGTCDHAIKVKGVTYEIGVVPRKDGKGWSIVWDFWGCGKQIDAVIGNGAEKLMTAYSEEAASSWASMNGYTMNNMGVDADGNMLVELTQY